MIEKTLGFLLFSSRKGLVKPETISYTIVKAFALLKCGTLPESLLVGKPRLQGKGDGTGKGGRG